CAAAALISWRQTTSGRSRSIQSRTWASRARIPLTFQVAIFIGGEGACRERPASELLQTLFEVGLRRFESLAALVAPHFRELLADTRERELQGPPFRQPLRLRGRAPARRVASLLPRLFLLGHQILLAPSPPSCHGQSLSALHRLP